MDLQRLFLILIFSFSLVLVWDGWQRYQHPEHFVQQSEPTSKGLPTPQTALPAATGQNAPLGPGQGTISRQSDSRPTGQIINVKTDLLEADISSVGGDIFRLALLKQPDVQDKSKPLVLFHRGEGTHNYIAQSGLLGKGLPNHNTQFVSEQDSYELSGNVD